MKQKVMAARERGAVAAHHLGAAERSVIPALGDPKGLREELDSAVVELKGLGAALQHLVCPECALHQFLGCGWTLRRGHHTCGPGRDRIAVVIFGGPPRVRGGRVTERTPPP